MSQNCGPCACQIVIVTSLNIDSLVQRLHLVKISMQHGQVDPVLFFFGSSIGYIEACED